MRYSFTMNAVIALIFANSAMGQESVNAAGGNGSSLNGKISYSVGQVSYKVVSNSNVKINEGVQQPIQVTAVVLPTDLVVSNYISPNNDGNNDTWKMIPLEIAAKYAIVISDQWGTVVFQKDGNYQNEWDATFSGKKLPDGVYYYSLLENDQVVGKGSITVLSN